MKVLCPCKIANRMLMSHIRFNLSEFNANKRTTYFSSNFQQSKAQHQELKKKGNLKLSIKKKKGKYKSISEFNFQ
ncbi:hypothetical protein CICLE_v10013258mg [Citrus x clementina]|uniref:Uncharacterized protein n=1 Tax=Citrus clementina TaxID=85681 RepID=V4UR66_CITCL|nr:hypothetical protein CICLE_v10013258mg [Citrus x clementina]